MIYSVELLKLDTYRRFRERIKGLDPRKEWKYFKKLVQAEVGKEIIKSKL